MVADIAYSAQIGDQTVGVRIAVRDMLRQTDGTMDSQIYHWGIKEDAPLGGAGRGQNRISSGASSDAFSKVTIPQAPQAVNPASYAALLRALAAERRATSTLTPRQRIALDAWNASFPEMHMGEEEFL